MHKKNSERGMFRKFHHIGILVKDVKRAKEYLESLGVGPFGPPDHDAEFIETTFRGKPASFKNERLVAKMEGLEIELFTPSQGDAPGEAEFLNEKGDGIHHIAFEVEDLDQEVEKLVKKGNEVLESARWQGGGIAFLTSPSGGINIELLQFG